MKQTTNTRTTLLTQNPWKLMLSLSIPSIIGMVVVGLYSFMDSVFAGQMLGTTAMAAISISYPFTLINNGIATLVGVGSASVLSRAIGEKDKKTVNAIMGNLLAVVSTLSIVVMLIGTIFTRQILQFSGAEGEILELAVRYLRIVYFGSVFVNFAQSANMIMRGEGLLKKAMFIMGLGAVINIVLDPVFILLTGKIEGAAYATILAQFIQASITLFYFLKKSENVKIGKIKIHKNLLGPIVSVGFSAMLMQVMTLFQQTITYNVASRYGGETWQILLSAALRIQAFAFIPLWGISQGFQPAAGTNFGARQYKRLRKITSVFFVGATTLALLFYIPIQLLPKTILSLFITDPDIVLLGISDFRIYFSLFIVLGIFICSITLFQAIGQAGKASVLVMARQIVLFIPAMLLLPRIAGLGIRGVWLAPVVTDFILLILAAIILIATFKKLPKENETL